MLYYHSTKSLISTPKLYKYQCDRIVLYDPNKQTGYSLREMSKP